MMSDQRLMTRAKARCRSDSHRTRFVAQILSLLVFAASCSSGSASTGSVLETDSGSTSLSTVDEEEGTTSSTAPPTTAKPTTTAEPTSTTQAQLQSELEVLDEVVVTLVDPGSEPRQSLRLDLEDGLEQTMVLAQTQELSQVIAGTQVPSAGPIGTYSLLDLRSLQEDERFRLTSTIVEMRAADDASAEVAALMNPALESMIGLNQEWLMNSRGRILEAGFQDPDQLAAIPPEMRTTVEQLGTSVQASNPLPEEAVGRGAIWETEQNLSVGGIDLLQVTVYRLVGVESSIIQLEVTIQQFVEPGTVIDAPGPEVVVDSWDVSGAGTMVWDLSQLVPTSEVVVTAHQVLIVVQPGTETVVNQTLIASTSISALE